MNGGTLNMTIENDYTNSYPTLTIGGWNGGTGHLAINDGTINLDGNFYQNNISPSGGLTPTVATAEQTGGTCLLYTSPSPRDKRQSRMPSSA